MCLCVGGEREGVWLRHEIVEGQNDSNAIN